MDFGDAVHDALVVDQYRVAGAGEGEFAQFPALRRADAGDAFAHVAALDQHHAHPVAAVAVHAFGRGAGPFAAARLSAARVDRSEGRRLGREGVRSFSRWGWPVT